MIIAVDGPAAAGKGTLARALAAHFRYHFLDTGSLYRMVALAMLAKGADPNDQPAAAAVARGLDPKAWREEELRSEDVARAASIVAANPGVRRALLGLQRSFAKRRPGAVLDGRDIGTVVCPDAEVKIFVTATPEVRAGRRARELAERGIDADYLSVLAEIRDRDERDSRRAYAPLIPAPDAYVLDTSGLDIDQAVAAAISYAESCVAQS